MNENIGDHHKCCTHYTILHNKQDRQQTTTMRLRAENTTQQKRGRKMCGVHTDMEQQVR